MLLSGVGTLTMSYGFGRSNDRRAGRNSAQQAQNHVNAMTVFRKRQSRDVEVTNPARIRFEGFGVAAGDRLGCVNAWHPKGEEFRASSEYAAL